MEKFAKTETKLKRKKNSEKMKLKNISQLKSH